MLRMRGLWFSYNGGAALRDVNLDFTPGRITALLGPNGAGKTTLLRNIMGLCTPSRGSIILDGTDLTGMPVWDRARAGVALVPQGRQPIKSLTVAENLQVALAARSDGRRSLPDTAYDAFPALKSLARRRAGALSGGQQQQLAIARALITQPRLLLLDEPTEGIERKTIDTIGQFVRRFADGYNAGDSRGGGMIVVLVEQNLGFVKEHADCFHVVDRGAVGPERPMEELDDLLSFRSSGE